MGPCIHTGLISLFLLKHSNSIKPKLSPASLSVFYYYSSTSSAEQTRITVADYLQQSHQFSPDTVFKLLSTVVKNPRDPENCNSVISFFKDIGFSSTQLDKMLNRKPNLIWANLDGTIKPKIKAFQDLGLSPKQIAEVVSVNPRVLHLRTSSMCSRVRELQKLLGNNIEWFVLLKKCHRLVTTNLEKSTIPNVELLKTKCGIHDSEIVKMFHLHPRTFFREHEFMKECVERVDEMGVQRDSKMFLYGVWSVGSMSVEKWKCKLEFFKSLGFSEDDIRSAFRRNPMAFATSEKKMKEATEVLLSAGNHNISSIVSHPMLLTYSVEKRIKPRLRVMQVLDTKNLIAKKPSLNSLLAMTNEKFMKQYVLPFSAEVGSIYPFKGRGVRLEDVSSN